MAEHTTRITVTHRDDQIPPQARLRLDPQLYMQDLAQFFENVGGGGINSEVSVYRDDGDAVAASGSISVSGASHGVAATGTVTLAGVDGTAAAASVALSGVGGTAATGTIAFSGSSGGWTVDINGTELTGTSSGDDDAAGDDLVGVIVGNGTTNALVTAGNSNGVVTLTAKAKGTAGNAITLAVSGTGVSRSAETLAGGEQGSVGVTINGTLVTTDTTDLADAAAATAVAAAIEANGTLAPLLAAAGDGADVDLTWGTKGTAGDAVTLSATSATGTATASGVTFSGGADNDVTVTVGGAEVVTDTTTMSNADAATAVAAALNADATASQYATASASEAVVTLTANVVGTVGNAISLAAATDGGTATASGATLSGGTDTSVLVTLNGVGLTVNTTTTTTDAQVAAAIEAAINGSANALIAGVVTAERAGDDVDLRADTKGATGNWITLAVSGTGITASGNRLTGGTEATDNTVDI